MTLEALMEYDEKTQQYRYSASDITSEEGYRNIQAPFKERTPPQFEMCARCSVRTSLQPQSELLAR